MDIPDAFPYREVFLRGRPRHEHDDFCRLHPPMERGKRAKIFAPFDALDGYGGAIRAKNTLYTDKILLSAEQTVELDRRLTALKNMLDERVRGRRTAGGRPLAPLPRVKVTYFVPCGDRFHDAFGRLGTYETAEGPCLSVDPDAARTVRVGGLTIAFDDIAEITGRQTAVPGSPPAEKEARYRSDASSRPAPGP